jgi:hypothetical protein
LLLGPVAGYFDPTDTPPLPPNALPLLITAVIVFALPFFGLFALVVYKAYRGRNWARWVLSVVTVCGVVPYVPYVQALFAISPIVATADVILALAELLAVALLFTAPSNAWYRSEGARLERAAA